MHPVWLGAKLGIRQSKIETRFIHSGADVAMYLAGVPDFLIMLIGRRSSTAFLKYIRKQVQELLQGILSHCHHCPNPQLLCA